ncbi:tail fiber protein [Erwinia persicina]|uniref:Tail fiber protein n=1 Tax=Erwinia persicina TaxID=55211 RepID=A0A4U3ETV7_9GAMM|nr:tail fiber protein [Erwinia persicina]MBD8109121.1 tail fiber protein [Erwinia persicina]MBD8170101.1 tail fiber protein [Erwinia persicina]MBD8212245.1 tail fiber protein [Erwinia persicina]TKJ83640.1 hypothetical protein EpCFBP13511_22495 [Erwinia persicina]
MADSNDKKTTTRKTKVTATPAAKSSVQKAALTASASAAGSLPTADALKERFKAGSIPLQTDFADLIDMADAGAQAAGKASGQNGAGRGLTLNSDLLEVKAGNGITVSASGVSIDPTTVLPKGIITMFSGSTMPDGWALCDGENGTPDLRDRFIMGGDLEGGGGRSSAKFSGENNAKKYEFSTDDTSVNVKGTSGGTALTYSQIPNHQHFGGARLYDVNYAHYGTTTISGGVSINSEWKPASGKYLARTSGMEGSDNEMGKSDNHTHSIDIRSDSHSHNIKLTVPYYILAFIIKL